MTPRGKTQPVPLSDQDAEEVGALADEVRRLTAERAKGLARRNARWQQLYDAGHSMRAIADASKLTVAAIAQRVGGKA